MAVYNNYNQYKDLWCTYLSAWKWYIYIQIESQNMFIISPMGTFARRHIAPNVKICGRRYFVMWPSCQSLSSMCILKWFWLYSIFCLDKIWNLKLVMTVYTFWAFCSFWVNIRSTLFSYWIAFDVTSSCLPHFWNHFWNQK